MNKIRQPAPGSGTQSLANRYRSGGNKRTSNVRNIPKPAEPNRKILKQGAPDFQLLVLTFVLVGFGILMVFSASSSLTFTSERFNYDSMYFTKRHIVFAVVGLIAMFFAMKAHYSKYKKWFAPFFMVTLLLLVAVLIIGGKINGARSWIQLPAGASIQPAELAKLAVILYLSALIAKKGERFRDLRTGYIPVMLIVGLVAGLIMLQPDLGSCMILVATAGLIIYAGGASVKHIFASVALLLLGAALVFGVNSLFSHDSGEKGDSNYRMGRIETFLDPFADEKGAGYNMIQSLTAIGQGGFSGSGFGQSIQKLHYLPNPYNDFIFSVIGEEFGFVGTTLFLLAYAYFIVRGIWISLRCPDIFGTLVGVGIMGMFAIQAFINIGGVTNTIPLTGVPLPFISYGGTSLVVMMLSMGIMLSISRETHRALAEQQATGSDSGTRRQSISMRMK